MVGRSKDFENSSSPFATPPPPKPVGFLTSLGRVGTGGSVLGCPPPNPGPTFGTG